MYKHYRPPAAAVPAHLSTGNRTVHTTQAVPKLVQHPLFNIENNNKYNKYVESINKLINYENVNNTDKLINNLKPLGLISTSRTGAVAMTRGPEIFK
jgi:hypothetical protein